MERHELYHGDVVLEFDDAKHRYTVNGEWVPSSTGILSVINKPALIPWAVKMALEFVYRVLMDWLKNGIPLDEIRIKKLIRDAKRHWRDIAEDAANIGTIVHQFAEDHARGESPELPVNPEARRACAAYLDWVKAHNVEFRQVEFKVYSREWEYAGTCDLDCVIDGVHTIADYKTSTGIYDEYWLQVASYAMARREELGIQYAQRAILRFDKTNGQFECAYRSVDRFDQDETAVIAARELYRWQQEEREASSQRNRRR